MLAKYPYIMYSNILYVSTLGYRKVTHIHTYIYIYGYESKIGSPAALDVSILWSNGLVNETPAYKKTILSDTVVVG